jgi:hypothetical protein
VRTLHFTRFACVCFVVLYGIAVWLYPGGSPFDHAHRGYDLADNYVCDTFRARAYDGTENPIGAPVGQAGMLALVFAAATSLFAAPALFSVTRPRLAMATRATAALAFLGMLAVPLTPAHEYGNLHFISVGVASVPSLLAAYGVGFGMWGAAGSDTRHDQAMRAMTALALVASTIHFGQYLSQALFHAGENPWIPRSQKIVLAIDLAWIAALSSWGIGRAERAAATTDESGS